MNKKKIESLEDMISVSETFSDAYNMFVSLINKNCVSGVVMYFQSCITIAAVYLEYIAGLTNKKDKNFSNEEIKIIEIWNSLTEREKGEFIHLYREICNERKNKNKENAG